MPIVLCECVALYEYKAETENHLSLMPGDKISVYVQEASGWWSGFTAGGASGWFPGAFVEVVPAPSAFPSAAAGNIARNRQSDIPAAPLSPLSSKSSGAAGGGGGEWEQHLTENGDPYFVNSLTGESRWSLPGSTCVTPVAEENWDAVPIDGMRHAHSTDSGFGDRLADELHAVNIVSPTSSSASSIHNNTRASMISTRSKAPSMQDLSFTDPRPAPVATDGKFGYTNNFWSDKADKSGLSGFDLLVLKHRNGKEVCKDIAQFMSERARIEEVYAKSLMDLAKSNLGDLESGTAKTAWNQLKFDMLTQAKSRAKFAAKLAAEVQAPIMAFKNEQKKLRKNYEQTIAADRKSMFAKHLTARRMRKAYITRSKEAELVDMQVQRGPGNAVLKRDFEKLEEAARKERKKASMAAYDYKTAVEDYERVRKQWEDDMHSATYEFQQAEEERLEYLKTVLQSYLTAQQQLTDECKEAGEMVVNSVDAVSKTVDIEMFVKEHYTGSFKPEPLTFEQYKSYC
eukprot:Partr_v1_DN25819_c0_g1_i1_m2951 putative Inherit from NOG: Growth arrest-specific 7